MIAEIPDGEVAVPDIAAVPGAVRDGPHDSMHPIGISTGIDEKITHGTAAVGIVGEKCGYILSVSIIDRVPDLDSIYIHIDGRAVRGYEIRLRG